jgi:hypothetical protein
VLGGKMIRVKGWVAKEFIPANSKLMERAAQTNPDGIIYVEEIPKGSLRGTATVVEETYFDHETGKEEGCGFLQVRIAVPFSFDGEELDYVLMKKGLK